MNSISLVPTINTFYTFISKKITVGHELFFKKNINQEIKIYIDADWASSITDRRFISRYYMYV